MSKIFPSFVVVFFVCYLFPAMAGAELGKQEGTLLNIAVSERAEVKDDLLVANLRFEYEGGDPKLVQNEINKSMNQALELVKRVPDISISTEQYNVYKYYPNRKQKAEEKKEYIWHGNQGLRLSGKSADSILKITGELQELGMILGGLNYTISDDKMEEVRDNMMEAAIEKLLKKSQRAAKALGKSNLKMVQINIDSNNYIPPLPQMRGAMAEMAHADKMEAPVAEPGQSQVVITISASVLIKD